MVGLRKNSVQVYNKIKAKADRHQTHHLYLKYRDVSTTRHNVKPFSFHVWLTYQNNLCGYTEKSILSAFEDVVLILDIIRS